jgi:hypothetical protein
LRGIGLEIFVESDFEVGLLEPIGTMAAVSIPYGTLLQKQRNAEMLLFQTDLVSEFLQVTFALLLQPR